MTTLAFDMINPVIPIDDLASVCDAATHFTVQVCGRRTSRPGNAMLRGIVFGGVRYDDKGAACSCADLTLYKFCTTGYTHCKDHGVQEIGMLYRELSNGRRK